MSGRNMQIKWIKLTKQYNKCCGQIAIAIICNISVEKAIKLVGKSGPTKTRELAFAFKKMGYLCKNRCYRMKRPNLGLGQLHWHRVDRAKKKYLDKWTPNWHWVVIDGDRTYDGYHEYKTGEIESSAHAKITSYLPIVKRDAFIKSKNQL